MDGCGFDEPFQRCEILDRTNVDNLGFKLLNVLVVMRLLYNVLCIIARQPPVRAPAPWDQHQMIECLVLFLIWVSISCYPFL